jgi:formate dehydrogenase maturation protein FdhE
MFDTINRTSPEDTDVKFSLDFLKTKAAFLTDISDMEEINSAFIRDIIGRFNTILSDADEVRSRLEDVVPLEHYEWYGNPTIQREVEKLAQAKYNQYWSEKVLEKIEKLDDYKTKEYLKRLIKNNMNIGIEILSE